MFIGGRGKAVAVVATCAVLAACGIRHGQSGSGSPAGSASGGSSGTGSGDSSGSASNSVATGEGQLPTGLPAGPVGQAGRWLTDGQGRALLLHGVNVVAKDAPYYPSAFGFDDADAAWLAANGFEVVRLGVLPAGEMPTQGHIDTRYIDTLVATVNDLARHHIFTLLDWHQDDYGTYFDEPGTQYRADGFPSWMTVTKGAPNNQAPFPYEYTSDAALQQAFQSFWEDAAVPPGPGSETGSGSGAGAAVGPGATGTAGLQEYDITMLEAVARRVTTNPWVLGYEIMNEPWPGTSWLSCVAGEGCANLDASELDPFYAKAANALRRVDAHHVIFIEPFVTYNFGLAPTHVTVPAGVHAVALAFHQYAQVPAAEVKVFDNSLAWATANDGALLNTEWSSTGGKPGTIAAQAAEEDAALMPWTYWIFDNCDIACSSAEAANLLLDPRRPPSGTNVNAAVVDELVRPYPIAVAGTPSALTFDPATRVMTFSWSTRRPGASTAGASTAGASTAGERSFAAGALTSFATPSRVYPHGYTVSVTGGHVTSHNCASTLVVAQATGAATVSVTVKPATSCR